MKQEKIENFIHKHSLLKANSTVVIGVSGGLDSIALLHFLWALKEKWALTIIAATVDHRFRGIESYEDLMFVKEFCRKHQIIFEGTSIDVPAYAEEHHLSSQVAARKCRYDFYHKILAKHNGHYLALAHHGDDQVETMLMRMVRGSYGMGVAGIPVKRKFHQAMIIRPFLCLTKEEIEQYIDVFNLPFRLDPSNEKDDYQRNRFRHHIIPFLKAENPNVSERFQTLSELLTEDYRLLEQFAEEKIEESILEKTETKVVFLINEFHKLPIPLQRRGIHLILKYLYKRIPSNFATIHTSQLLSLLENEHPSGMLHFPKGLIITRSYNKCILAFEEKTEKEIQAFSSCYLPIPGEVVITDHYSIRAEWIDKIPEKIDRTDSFICDQNEIALPLHIRTRRNGDRMTLKGMKGTKKIKDIFIDQKIPKSKRDFWPIVEDANGHILWLPQLKKSSFSIESQPRESRNGHLYLLLQYISYNKEL